MILYNNPFQGQAYNRRYTTARLKQQTKHQVTGS
jgi:hypothetical protein